MDVAQNARTQVLFREVNERILSIQGKFGEPLTVLLLCECGQGCGDKIEREAAAYERVRGDATHFLVAAGHHVPEVDRMVEDHGSWQLVEAYGVAAEIARKGLAA